MSYSLLTSVVTACKAVVIDEVDDDGSLLLEVLSGCDVVDLVELIAVQGGLLVRLLADVAASEGEDIDSFIQRWALGLAE